MTASVIEKELVEASGFAPTKNYERQDYLAGLARAVNEVDEDTFDGLSTDAQDWFNDAVKALNKKKDLPEFPDMSGNGEAEEEEEGNPTDDNPEKDDPEEDENEPEAEEAPPPKAAKKSKKPGPVPPPKKGRLPQPVLQKGETPVPGDSVDKFGLGMNTKGHQAAMMFEEGCRMSDVTEAVGGTYYNLLQKMVKAGHKLEKAANGYIQLTHKDASPKKGKGKK